MRKSARQLVGCIALLAGMVACAQPDQTLSPLDRAAAIAFTPDSAPCAPELLEPVREKLKTFTRDDIVALLASDDPHARGVGVYLCVHRPYLDLLIDNPHLMDDERASVPSAMCGALYIHPPSVTQTIVRRRYFDAVEFWFGRPGNTAEQQAALHPPKTDPWSYARPWEILVNHAQQAAPEERADLKARDYELDPWHWRGNNTTTASPMWRIFNPNKPYAPDLDEGNVPGSPPPVFPPYVPSPSAPEGMPPIGPIVSPD